MSWIDLSTVNNSYDREEIETFFNNFHKRQSQNNKEILIYARQNPQFVIATTLEKFQ
jgi:hypothetical protein